MYSIENVEMLRVTIPASEYGKGHTIHIVPVDGLYGVWLSREDSDKVLYIYCLDIGPQEELIREVMDIVPMYIDFCAPEFDDDGPIWP